MECKVDGYMWVVGMKMQRWDHDRENGSMLHGMALIMRDFAFDPQFRIPDQQQTSG